MTAAQPALTLVVVGFDRLAVSETFESLMWQSEPLPKVTHTSAQGLKQALDEVATEWISVLPEGVQLSPRWLSFVNEFLARSDVGAVGGRTLELRGCQTEAAWFEAQAKVTSVDILGRCHSQLEDLPSCRVSASALFLRWDNMVCRTEFVREALEIEDDVVAALHAVRPCAIAIRGGLEVVYDSEIRCSRRVPPGDEPSSSQARPDTRRRMANQEIFELAGLPRRSVALWAVVSSTLVGTRRSPGLLLGVAYAWWPERRRRWQAFMSGKMSGLRRVIRPGSASDKTAGERG